MLFFCACLAGVSKGQFVNPFDLVSKWKASMDAISNFNKIMQVASMSFPKPPAGGPQEAQGEVDGGAADAGEAKAEVGEGAEAQPEPDAQPEPEAEAEAEATNAKQEEAGDGDAAVNETKEEVPESKKK